MVQKPMAQNPVVQTSPANDPASGVAAARGVVFIAFAKLYFMVAGYVIYFILPRLLQTEERWGEYLLVIGLASVIDNVIITATIQAVSRFTAQGDIDPHAIKRIALKMQLLLGGLIAGSYCLLSPLIARWEKDPSLTGYYQLSSVIVFCYALYSVFVGSANGLKQFHKQAGLDVTFSTLRMALILIISSVTASVYGAVGGFAAASAMIVIVSAVWVGLPRRDAAALPSSFGTTTLLKYTLQLYVYTFALNLMMRMDLFLLKRFVTDLALGSTAELSAQIASRAAGYYGTAQTLAFIPYQAILAVTFVIFPLISRTTFDQDASSTRAYIAQTLRFSLLFVCGVAVVFIANPEAVINVPYQASYRVGGPALRWLAAGMICFSMFTIINTILNAAGKTRVTIFLGVTTLVLVTIANWIAIPGAKDEIDALLRAAIATSASFAVGTLLAGIVMYRAYGSSLPALSVFRVLAAMAVSIAVARTLPEVSKLVTLGECILVLGVYLVVLIVLREFNATDLASMKRILRRGKRGSH